MIDGTTHVILLTPSNMKAHTLPGRSHTTLRKEPDERRLVETSSSSCRVRLRRR